jgi:NAD(P)-dependent dehydrogenase (short-subunit alcohol dehydrogenase family)
MAKRKILIAGASGLVGFATVRHFAQLDDWEVAATAIRRRAERRNAPCAERR